MIEILTSYDTQLFFLIHDGLRSTFLDNILPILRNKITWIPLYIFILYYTYKVFDKKIWYFIAISIGIVVVGDTICASILKPWVGRMRPCRFFLGYKHFHDFYICSSTYSFPSCHATNHSALAVFWSWSFKKRWLSIFLTLWALVVGYAQIYVGVHYPTDILGGFFIGSSIGYLGYKLSLLFFQPSIKQRL